jgi:hypothetical protein
VTVPSGCLQARLSSRETGSVRCGRPCRSSSAICESVTISLTPSKRGALSPRVCPEAPAAAAARLWLPCPVPGLRAPGLAARHSQVRRVTNP